MIAMTKWCFNYDSGEYEDIDKDGLVIHKAKMFITGTTANTAVKRKNADTKKMKKIGNRNYIKICAAVDKEKI